MVYKMSLLWKAGSRVIENLAIFEVFLESVIKIKLGNMNSCDGTASLS